MAQPPDRIKVEFIGDEKLKSMQKDFKIEELLDVDTMKVYFRILSLGSNPGFATPIKFETLEAAEWAVKELRKYKERIFHFV